ncbi:MULTISPECIES: hypothetical protein [unclassified Rhizobacter]|uniref:hypothetical protein n=1 Tax=unclassified Rhizobacter TaxID=2640088 RepID=UPI000A583AA1|nr:MULTISPECIES: hypothetical protein [unclassified Rhizobacter]
MRRTGCPAGVHNLPGVLRLAVPVFVAHELRAVRWLLMLDDRARRRIALHARNRQLPVEG